MSSAPSPGRNRSRQRDHRLAHFWERVTEGLELEQLWGQFMSDAKASYGLYSKDVDWDEIQKERSKIRRIFLSIWAMFQAMLMKLSPAKRVLLLLAIVLLALHPDFRWGSKGELSFSLGGLGVFILFILSNSRKPRIPSAHGAKSDPAVVA